MKWTQGQEQTGYNLKTFRFFLDSINQSSQEFALQATDGVPKGFGKELYPPDIDRLAPHLEAAMDLVPCFANAEIQASSMHQFNIFD